MSAELEIAIHCSDWNAAVTNAAGLCSRAAGVAWELAIDSTGSTVQVPEVGLVLTDDAEIAGLNLQFRGIEGPTNVLSFPSGETVADAFDPNAPPIMLGDIVIALETTAREAERDGKSVANHLQHLVVHGLLHLLGHDHQDDREADEMESLEVEILSRLSVPNPYIDGTAPI